MVQEDSLPPPLSTPFTKDQLAQYTGSSSSSSSSSSSIYLAIKGTIFDVSSKKDFYGPGASYHVLAGREAQRALALSSLRPEDVKRSDIDDLTPDQMKTLNEWEEFFRKRYPIVGKLIANE